MECRGTVVGIYSFHHRDWPRLRDALREIHITDDACGSTCFAQCSSTGAWIRRSAPATPSHLASVTVRDRCARHIAAWEPEPLGLYRAAHSFVARRRQDSRHAFVSYSDVNVSIRHRDHRLQLSKRRSRNTPAGRDEPFARCFGVCRTNSKSYFCAQRVAVTGRAASNRGSSVCTN